VVGITGASATGSVVETGGSVAGGSGVEVGAIASASVIAAAVSVTKATAGGEAGWAGSVSATTSGSPFTGKRRSVASQPPKNKAVKALKRNVAIRARWARAVSSSLTMGKMALRASRAERKDMSAAITVAPMLIPAKISRIVGKETTLIITPQFQFGRPDLPQFPGHFDTF
jgi:hypothetical protein